MPTVSPTTQDAQIDAYVHWLQERGLTPLAAAPEAQQQALNRQAAPGSVLFLSASKLDEAEHALLLKMISAMKLTQTVHYAHAVDRPHALTIAVQHSASYVLLLGAATMRYFPEFSDEFAHSRGQARPCADLDAVSLLVTQHPSLLLNNQEEKRLAWAELQVAMRQLSARHYPEG